MEPIGFPTLNLPPHQELPFMKMKTFLTLALATFSSWAAPNRLTTLVLAEQTGTPRAFFAADYEKKVAAVINEDGSVRWSMNIKNIHDAQPLANGNWLLQTNFDEVREVNNQGETVWVYNPESTKGKRVEIHAFQELADGQRMIAESGNTRLVFLDAKHKVIGTTPLRVTKVDPHRDTRLVRATPENTFLVCHEHDQLIREYDREGKTVWEYPVGKKAYSAIRLANGNTLIGTGDGHSVIEVTPDKEIAWQVTENELDSVKLGWITMVDRLPNGNTWIVNCHGGNENPQIIEVAPDKKVVWSFKDFDRFGNSLPVAVPLK